MRELIDFYMGNARIMRERLSSAGYTLYGGDNARRDYEAWIAVRESALRGSEWIDLPLTEETELERRINAAFREKYGVGPEENSKLANVPFTRASVIWDVAGWL